MFFFLGGVVLTSQRRRLISPSSFTQPGGNPDVVAIITRTDFDKKTHMFVVKLGTFPLFYRGENS